MNYVMSDLHGCYNQFLEMLDLIKFSEEDRLYIIGDVVDRGPNPVKLLKDLSERPNVCLLTGNHDYIMAKVLNALPLNLTLESLEDVVYKDLEDQTSSGELVSNYYFWMDNGGISTLREYFKTPLEDRDRIIKFLNNLAPYHELTVAGQKYLLVHSIPRGFDKNRKIEDYEISDLLFYRIDNDKWDGDFYDDKILIVGHTPTFYIDRNYTGKMYKRRRIINVDCGCVYEGYGGRLCCLRLEDMKEYYI